MSTRGIALSLVLALQTSAVDAISYQAGAGVLSYTFFNLSPSTCTLTPQGSGYGPNWNGLAYGVGFFNSPFGGDKGSRDDAAMSYIFYNSEDPIATPASGTAYSIVQGQSHSGTEPSLASDTGENPAAMGDMWTLACEEPVGSTTAPPVQLLSSLASATNMLGSGTNSSYPYSVAVSGTYQNAALNPFNFGTCSSYDAIGMSGTNLNPCAIGLFNWNPNPNVSGTSWMAAGYNYNLNVEIGAANYSPTGGLWLGVNPGVLSGGTALAVNTMNAAMFPVNLAAYVQSDSYNSSVTVSGQGQISTPIFGGHMTLALGDPFVVNSYAAKMLWFTVLNYPDINNGTTLANLQGLLAPSAGDSSTGVFPYGSMEDNYVNWLFDAPGLAAAAYQSAFKAASVPITHESVWGKVFVALTDVAMGAALASLAAIPGGAVATGVLIATAGGLVGGSGLVVPEINSAIGAAFTSTTSGPAPASQAAPAVVNPTYASANLLGMLLTNVGVQSAINGTVPPQGTVVNPLWANYSINLDSLCTSISVANSQFSGNCAYGSSNAQQANGSGYAATGTYGNVMGADSTSLNLWDAVLTGSDVTTNSDGWMIIGNSVNGMSSFSPPIQMLNATNGATSATASLSVNASASTSFNLNTGYATLNALTVSPPAQAGASSAPLNTPQVNLAQSGPVPPGVSFTAAFGVYYYSYSGSLTISGYTADSPGAGQTNYDFSNGSQTLDLTTCPENALVLLTITPNPNSANASGAAGSLSCLLETAMSVTLNYQNCTSDPWASGGMYTAITAADANGNPQNAVLACACVPGYLDGPVPALAGTSQQLGGVVVGATSSSPDQRCPLPTSTGG